MTPRRERLGARRPERTLTALLATAVLLGLPAAGSTTGPASAASVAQAAPDDVRSDFNGDGLADLAVGVPSEDVGSVVDAGAVNVLYGTTSGLAARGSDFWHQDSPGVAGSSRTGDHFGWAVAAGDFDGDRISDLAIGVPDKGVGLSADEGVVQVLRGTPTGLVAWQSWNVQNATANVADAPCSCRFGAALAAGDFDHDGRDDLAVGMPSKDLVGDGSRLQPALMPDAGAVAVIYGSASGLSAVRFAEPRFALITPVNGDAAAYHHDEVGYWGGDVTGLQLGSVLAAGDHNGAGFPEGGGAYEEAADDLVIGGSRSVTVLYGEARRAGVTDGGLRASLCGETGSTTCKVWMASAGEANAVRSLAMGDVDDGRSTPLRDEEIFIGVPLADPGGVANAGSVVELRDDGSVRTYAQGSATAGAREAGDRLGWALATGDFTGDGFDDLAIGVPFEDVGAQADAGIVHVLPSLSRSGGRELGGWTTWSQASTDVPGAVEAGDRFGASLTAADLGRGAYADLAVGVPLEDLTAGGLTRSNAGVTDVLYDFGLPGLSTTDVHDWSQATSGVLGGFEANDQFGSVLAR